MYTTLFKDTDGNLITKTNTPYKPNMKLNGLSINGINYTCIDSYITHGILCHVIKKI